MRKKVGIYKVYFYDNTGSTSTVFKKLNKAVTKNGYLTLPELPQKSGYKAVGWSTKKNASQAAYTEGQKIRIKKKYKIYMLFTSLIQHLRWLCARMMEPFTRQRM